MMADYSFQTREDMARSLLTLIRPLKKHYSPKKAYLNIGATGVHYGSRIAAMEGFARILWGLGPLFSQLCSYDEEEIQTEGKEWKNLILQGIIAGTDPKGDEYWGDMEDYDQRIVEAAAIVVLFLLNRDMWHGLKEEEKSNLYQWLNQMNRCEMPKNNWRFFRVLANALFELLDLPSSSERFSEDKKLIEDSYLEHGWYVDGGKDKMDYYIAFAFHFYGQIYGTFMKERDPEWAKVLQNRAEAFAEEFLYFFANDGSSIPFGRSLIYRFAQGAFWSAFAFCGSSGTETGVVKQIFVNHMEGWFKKPIFDQAGILTIGYSYPNMIMAEHYNGPGSPYWSLKAFLILALPKDHEFWKAEKKEFHYETHKRLKSPHMIITHGANHSVMAYPAGQHCPGNHGHISEKYEKFVYSNQFGFSISRGYECNDGAFDNTIAFSHGGENRFVMMQGCKKFLVEEDYLKTVYEPVRGVQAESIIIPCSPWHVRIHKITCEAEIDIIDGGFSIQAESSTGIKYSQSQIRADQSSAEARLPWGISAMVSLSGGAPEVIQCFPNTNVMHSLTVMPLIRHHLKAGSHVLVSCVFGDASKELDTFYEERPEVEISKNGIVVKYKEKEIVVNG